MQNESKRHRILQYGAFQRERWPGSGLVYFIFRLTCSFALYNIAYTSPLFCFTLNALLQVISFKHTLYRLYYLKS